MFTRCSNCEAIFEISQNQLETREGLVRCGVCKNVFNAKWFLLDSEREGDPRESPELGVLQEDATDPKHPTLDEGASEEALETDEPEIAEQNAPPLPEALFEEIESRREPSLGSLNEEESLLEKAEQPDRSGGRGKRVDPELDDDQDINSEDGPAEELTEEPTEEQVEEQDYGLDDDADESVDDWAYPDEEGDESGLLLDRERMVQFDTDLELEEPSLENREDLELDPAEASSHRSGAGLPPAKDAPISLQSVDTYLKPRSSPLATLLWTIASLFFLFTLVLQIRTFHIDALASNESLRPYVAGFCRIVACELPPRSDPARFTITHTRIALHPVEPGALSISVNLINEAEFVQSYPDLQLTLTDRVGRIVGRRSFQPREYLAPGMENRLSPQTLGKVQIDLAHPHEQAVGFEIDVINSG